jgi:hypothetical protein
MGPKSTLYVLTYCFRAGNTQGSGFTSAYTPGKKVDSTLWGPGQPSSEEPCMHCTWDGCSDDACDTELDSHVCEYPVGGLPVLQLRGLCKKSKIGRKSNYFLLRRDKASPYTVYPKNRLWCSVSWIMRPLDDVPLGWRVPDWCVLTLQLDPGTYNVLWELLRPPDLT